MKVKDVGFAWMLLLIEASWIAVSTGIVSYIKPLIFFIDISSLYIIVDIAVLFQVLFYMYRQLGKYHEPMSTLPE